MPALVLVLTVGQGTRHTVNAKCRAMSGRRIGVVEPEPGAGRGLGVWQGPGREVKSFQ